MTTNQTASPIRLDVSKQGRSVRLIHPSFEKPRSLRLTNQQRERVLDLLTQQERRALLYIESLLLLKGGDPDVRRSANQ